MANVERSNSDQVTLDKHLREEHWNEIIYKRKERSKKGKEGNTHMNIWKPDR